MMHHHLRDLKQEELIQATQSLDLLAFLHIIVVIQVIQVKEAQAEALRIVHLVLALNHHIRGHHHPAVVLPRNIEDRAVVIQVDPATLQAAVDLPVVAPILHQVLDQVGVHLLVPALEVLVEDLAEGKCKILWSLL
jgi:hypothetical protein